MKTFAVDGNWYLHRSFSVCARTRKIEFLEKNTLDQFLKMVAGDALFLKATHIIVVFDSKRSWRHDIFPEYKANRNKGATEVVTSTGESLVLDITAGSLVSKAKKICELAGLPVAQKKGYEGDDLIACVCASIKGKIILGTGDKDMASLVSDFVSQWLADQKILRTVKDVVKKFGVEPKHIPEFLALIGDKVDNIPGIPGVADKTASKWLNAHGSISRMLKNDAVVKKKLKPYLSQLAMAKKLTTLRTGIVFSAEDLVPQKLDHSLSDYVWSIPTSLKELGDARLYASKQGLFGKR